MAQQTIQTLAAQAEKAYRAENFVESAALYQTVADLYSAAGDPLNAAEMTNNRSVALLRSGNPQGALEAAQNTDLVFAQAADPRRQAVALANQAAALEALNRPNEALALYWKSSDLLKQAGEHEQRAYVLKSISALQIRTGHQFEAIASMQAALQNQKKLTLKERMLRSLLNVPIQMLKRGS